MRFHTWLLALAGAMSLPSVAQHSATLDGDWVAKFNANGKPHEAKVVIRADTGTWKNHARSQGNPCIGLEMPIAIGKLQPDGFELGVNGSKALAGCEDLAIQMKRIDDKTFEGTSTNGKKFHLKRD